MYRAKVYRMEEDTGISILKITGTPRAVTRLANFHGCDAGSSRTRIPASNSSAPQLSASRVSMACTYASVRKTPNLWCNVSEGLTVSHLPACFRMTLRM